MCFRRRFKASALSGVRRLERLNKGLEKVADCVEESRAVFDAAVAELDRRIADEKQQHLRPAAGQGSSAGGGTGGGGGSKKKDGSWAPPELNLLIKAVNLFPAGTNQRWEVVANFVNQHHGGQRTAKEVLAQAKELQSGDFSRSALKEAANKAAYNKFEKESKSGPANEESVPSERYESMSVRYAHPPRPPLMPVSVCARPIAAPAEQLGMNLAPWSADEQRLLEQALKTYPASVPDRWDRIAEAVPNRSKKDCMRRYKVPSPL